MKIALQTVDYERRGGEGNNTQRFSCFHDSSQECKSVLHVIVSLDTEQILPYLKEAITSGEIVNKVLVTQVLVLPMNSYVKY